MAGIHDVRYYDSEMTGAPAPGLYGAGKMIALLDACLVNGFNLHPVEQIVVAAGVATATTSDEHGFRDYTVIRVGGCAEPALNGDWKSDVVAGTTFSWTTTVADGVYGGTMSAKTAPLGWTKEFSGTNVAVYRQKDGAQYYFRIDDNDVRDSLVSGYRIKTDASANGVGVFPGNGINFSKNADSSAVKWFVAGDGGTVYFLNAPFGAEGDSPPQYGDFALRGFGQFGSFVPDDVGPVFVAGMTVAGSVYYGYQAGGINYPGQFNSFYLALDSFQATPTQACIRFSSFAGGWGSASALLGLNPADNSFLFHHPVHIQEPSGSIRGVLPGLWQPINKMATKSNEVELVDGRRILLKKGPDVDFINVQTFGGRIGLIGFDITGPWR